MVAAFESFISLLPNDGTLIACIEDQGASSLMNRARRLGRHVIAYTLRADDTIKAQHWLQARNIKANERGGFDFEAVINTGTVDSVQVSLQVPGEHNVRNALAALAVIAVLDLSTRAAGVALGKFTGTGRRFEVKGRKKGITVIDDYAHHPTEIKATLAAARARYPNQRLWAVWQPHTYSRTKALFQDFSRAFKDADEVIVTEIYAAREPKQEFSSAEVVSAMSHPSVRFLASLNETTEYLLAHLRNQDVLLVLSAGDADQVSANVLAGL
jgi:UDP-N-acetylmuramate--alanine ligase